MLHYSLGARDKMVRKLVSGQCCLSFSLELTMIGWLLFKVLWLGWVYPFEFVSLPTSGYVLRRLKWKLVA
jgi:hypothetical protein